jgi:hypothetical protein
LAYGAKVYSDGSTSTSTGSTSTSTSTSSAPSAQTQTAARAGGGGAGTLQIPVTVPDITKGPVRAPAVPLKPGDIVEVFPIPTNTQVAFSALGPDAAKFGPRAYHAAAGNPSQYNVSNLAEIWVHASVNNEGVLLVVRSR